LGAAGVPTKQVISTLNAVIKDSTTNNRSAAVEWQSLVDKFKDPSYKATADDMKILGNNTASFAAAAKRGDLDFAPLLAKIKESPDAINEMATKTGTLSDSLTLLKNRLTLALEPLGTAIFGVTKDIVKDVTPAMDIIENLGKAFDKLPDPVKKATVVLGALAASSGPVITAGGSIASMLMPLAVNFGSIASAVIPLAPLFVVLGVGMAGVLAVVGPMVAGFAIAVVSSSTLRGVLGTLGTAFSTLGGHIMTAIGDLTAGNLQGALDEITKGIREFVNTLKTINWADVGNTIKNEIIQSLTNSQSEFNQVANQIATWITSIHWETVGQTLGQALVGGIQLFLNSSTISLDSLLGGAGGGGDLTSSMISGTSNSAVKAPTTGWQNLIASAKAAFDAFKKGFTEAASAYFNGPEFQKDLDAAVGVSLNITKDVILTVGAVIIKGLDTAIASAMAGSSKDKSGPGGTSLSGIILNIGLIATQIGPVAFVIYVIQQILNFFGITHFSDHSANMLVNLVAAVGGAWDTIMGGLATLKEWAGKVISFTANIIKAGWDFATDFVSKAVDFTANILKAGWDFATDFVGKVVDFTANILKAGWDFATDFVPKAVDFTANILKAGWDFATDFVGKSVDFTANILKAGWDFATDFVAKTVDWTVNIAASIGGAILGAGQSLWTLLTGQGGGGGGDSKTMTVNMTSGSVSGNLLNAINVAAPTTSITVNLLQGTCAWCQQLGLLGGGPATATITVNVTDNGTAQNVVNVVNSIQGKSITINVWDNNTAQNVVNVVNSIQGKSITINVWDNNTAQNVVNVVNSIQGKDVIINVWDNGTAASVQNTVNAIAGRDVIINVWDNGTCASVQATINAIQGKTVDIIINAQDNASGVVNSIQGKTVYVDVISRTSTQPAAEGMVVGMASGGHVTAGPQLALIGEAGPEAVIPQKYWGGVAPWVLNSLPKYAGGVTTGGSGFNPAKDNYGAEANTPGAWYNEGSGSWKYETLEEQVAWLKYIAERDNAGNGLLQHWIDQSKGVYAQHSAALQAINNKTCTTATDGNTAAIASSCATNCTTATDGNTAAIAGSCSSMATSCAATAGSCAATAGSCAATAGSCAATAGSCGTTAGCLTSNCASYASGGYVDKPQFAFIGEREHEYIIPESKMGGFGGGHDRYDKRDRHDRNRKGDTYIHVEGIKAEEIAREIARQQRIRDIMML